MLKDALVLLWRLSKVQSISPDAIINN